MSETTWSSGGWYANILKEAPIVVCVVPVVCDRESAVCVVSLLRNGFIKHCCDHGKSLVKQA